MRFAIRMSSPVYSETFLFYKTLSLTFAYSNLFDNSKLSNVFIKKNFSSKFALSKVISLFRNSAV